MSLIVNGGSSSVKLVKQVLAFQKVVYVGYNKIDLGETVLTGIELACNASGVGYGTILNDVQSVKDSKLPCACYVDNDNALHCKINLPNGQGFDSCTLNIFKFA